MFDLFIPGMVTGLFALIGAFIGAALTRRNEYEKWLRQERTQAFATLFRELHKTRLYATTAYYDESGTDNEKSTKVTEAFTLLDQHVNIARLFMSEAGRKETSALVKDLWCQCTVKGGPANRAIQIKELMSNIQRTVESELNYQGLWKLLWPFKSW